VAGFNAQPIIRFWLVPFDLGRHLTPDPGPLLPRLNFSICVHGFVFRCYLFGYGGQCVSSAVASRLTSVAVRVSSSSVQVTEFCQVVWLVSANK
jgi:hypothetical protein